MKTLISLLFCLLAIKGFAQTDTTQHVVPGRLNSKRQQQKPYVIMISADGFRYDYAKKYHAEHLLALSAGGVSAASMIPSYPSITFPNHYALVTGLYPSHHGIVNNDFYSPELNRRYHYKGPTADEGVWYGGTPLWVLAEQQKMLSASFYWVGSGAAIKDVRPSYYYEYNDKTAIHERITAIKNWLSLPAEKRPHFITVYFPQVDHEGHKHGAESPEVEQKVHFIDSAVYELTKAVKQTGLKVNYIFVSDHGMTTIPTNQGMEIPAAIDTSKFIQSGDELLVELYVKKGAEGSINDTYQQLLKEKKNYDVYLKTNIPAHFHYGAKDDLHNHIGDILLIPHYPYAFKMSKEWKIDPGTHGYDPYQIKDMHATFYAWGPAFKKHLKISSFENVNVFPIVTRLLGLHYTEKIDGTKAVAKKILTPPTP